jgi:hypothetical protein
LSPLRTIHAPVELPERHPGFRYERFDRLHHAGTNDDIPSFNIVSCKQFYDGVIAEFIANDDITNPVFMMKDDSALTHLNAPLGYLIKKE